MSETAVSVVVQEVQNSVTVNDDSVTVNVSPKQTSVAVSSAVATGADNIPFSGTGTVSQAGSVATAIQTLADNFFNQVDTPTGSNLNEGDLWYDSDDNQLKVYRETSTNVFEFVPLAQATGTMNNLDGGLFQEIKNGTNN